MLESIFNSERLAAIAENGMVEYYGPQGYTSNGNDQIRHLAIYIDGQMDPLGIERTQELRRFTGLVSVPLSSKSLPDKYTGGLNREDTIICIFFKGQEIDQYKRSGTFRAAVIMSSGDAQKFVEEVKEEPTLVYTLIRHVNGGAVKRFDGNLMDIRAGEAVVILPNEKLGGNIKEKIVSKSFPEGFQPNLL